MPRCLKILLTVFKENACVCRRCKIIQVDALKHYTITAISYIIHTFCIISRYDSLLGLPCIQYNYAKTGNWNYTVLFGHCRFGICRSEFYEWWNGRKKDKSNYFFRRAWFSFFFAGISLIKNIKHKAT